MAFENKKSNFSKMLKQTEEENKPTNVSKDFDTFERTKQYQFTLQPSVREKIDKLAKANGYRSASSYINEHFKDL